MSAADTVRETILRHGMITAGEHIIAGLSGGADSVCLLLCLNGLTERLGFTLSAVHVNHCLRGEESDGDMRFCQVLCAKLHIPLTVYTVDVMELVREKGLSVEEAARDLRYKCFAEEAGKYRKSKVATAHNRNDCTETMLFNFTRGTGIRGLRGIPYVRDCIIRPMLDVTRDEAEAFLQAEHQSFVTDSSNLSDDYSRNRLRHRVIPQLLSINSNFQRAAAALSANAAEDEEYFEQLIKKLSPETVREYPPSVRKRFIRQQLALYNIPCGFDRLNELDGYIARKMNTAYDLSGNIFAVFRDGVMSIEARSICADVSFAVPVSFQEEQVISIGEFDKIVKIKRINCDFFKDSSNVNENLTNNLLNYDKIQGVAVIRPKKNGDCYALKGRSFSTKLKKLHNALKLTVEERRQALVIEDSGGIVWSEYGGIAERAAVHSESDKNVFLITVGTAEKGGA